MDAIPIIRVDVAAYNIPTDSAEADGTIAWDNTTLIIVWIEAGGKKGMGYTYADDSAAFLINKKLSKFILQKNALDIEGITLFLTQQIRNNGNCGIAAMAVSAMDNALWDLKAKILNLPLCKLLGQVKDEMLLYGSGGFTTYTKPQLQEQFTTWAKQGITYMKMKIGTQPEKDKQRVAEARQAIGEKIKLMVDANGAFSAKDALAKVAEMTNYNVMWFEEPVTSDNLKGLKFIREHAPATMSIAAGEYGYNLFYFEAMVHAGAVDVLQADATRCGGITGFLKAGVLAEAYHIPFSSHCAPALHLHPCITLPSFFIGEYFHDHERIEQMLFDGTAKPKNGTLKPDLSRAGLGLELKVKDADKYKL